MGRVLILKLEVGQRGLSCGGSVAVEGIVVVVGGGEREAPSQHLMEKMTYVDNFRYQFNGFRQ